MKKLTVLWIGLLFYPVILFFRNIFNVFSNLSSGDLLLLGISELIIFTGYFIRSLLYGSEKRHKRISNITETAIGFIPAITACIIFNNSKAVALSIMFITLYLMGIKIYSTSYKKLVTVDLICISSGFYLVVMFILQIMMNPGMFLKYCIMFIASIYLYFLLHNQKSIDTLMSTRNYDTKYLPKETRLFNLRLIGLVCIISSIILLLRKQISNLIFLCLGFLASVFNALLDLISKVVKDDEPVIPPEKTLPDDEEIIASSIPYAQLILCTLIIIAGTIIIFINRKKIAQFFKITVYNMVIFIRNIFGSKDDEQNKKYNRGYTDFFETVKESPVEDKKPSYKQQAKLWKKHLKKFNLMPDDNTKFRFGYGLALSGIKLTGTDTKISDTPNEIAEKTGSDRFTSSTDQYNGVRYGSSTCNKKTITDINNILKEISEKI